MAKSALTMYSPVVFSSNLKTTLHNSSRSQLRSKLGHLQSNNESSSDVDSDNQSSTSEDWEEGSTLIDGFQVFDESYDERLNTQSNAVETLLRDRMDERFAQFKQEMVDTLVPSFNHVRLVHDYLEDETDKDFRLATESFNEVCEEAQYSTAQHREELLEMLNSSRATLRNLFGTLKDLYDERSQVFAIADQIRSTLDPALVALVDTAPKDIENFRSQLERKSKSLLGSDKKTDPMKQLMLAMGGR